MHVREATIEDARAIAEVHLASWKTTYPGIIPQEHIDGLRVEDGRARWETRLREKTTMVFVAVDEAGVFGFAAGGSIMHPVDGYEGELAAIYLLASHQGKGAGAALAFCGGVAEAGIPEHGGLGAAGESGVRVLSADGRSAGG
jgi:L-amino acid N-acyltransferase YncA